MMLSKNTTIENILLPLKIQSQYHFSLAGVYCGNNNKKHANCKVCPKSNDTLSNTWCSGDCDYDEANYMCKESNYHILEKMVFTDQNALE